MKIFELKIAKFLLIYIYYISILNAMMGGVRVAWKMNLMQETVVSI